MTTQGGDTEKQTPLIGSKLDLLVVEFRKVLWPCQQPHSRKEFGLVSCLSSCS